MIKKVGIIIRTLNEGKWLNLCLTAVSKQTYKNYEIIGIDSGSTDLTLEIFKKHKIKTQHIEKYRPGLAINMGIDCSNQCDYYVILSAHCIPTDCTWLERLVGFMEKHPSVAGAYGNQLPMTFTSNENTRDLIVTFRDETNINRNKFFHNANSIIRHDAVQKVRFDGIVQHIEDIIWARDILEAGYDLGFVKEAAVTHYHGTNQHANNYASVRSQGLNNVFDEKKLIQKFSFHDLFTEDDFQIQNVCFSEKCECNQDTCISIRRSYSGREKFSVGDLIKKVSLDCLHHCDGVIALQLFNSCQRLDNVKEWREEFFDLYPNAIIPVEVDYGNYWSHDGENLKPIQSNLKKRSGKDKILKEKLLMGGIVHVNALFNPMQRIENPILKEI